MNFRKRKREESEVESGALSDILFFLMLFFLMISTMASPDALKMLLPKATTGKDVPTREVIDLSVKSDGQYFVNAQSVGLDELEEALRQAASEKNAESVRLSIPKDKTVQDLVDVIDVVNRVNLHMVLAVDKVK
jgi:biopolymer transport protein ExbD